MSTSGPELPKPAIPYQDLRIEYLNLNSDGTLSLMATVADEHDPHLRHMIDLSESVPPEKRRLRFEIRRDDDSPK